MAVVGIDVLAGQVDGWLRPPITPTATVVVGSERVADGE